MGIKKIFFTIFFSQIYFLGVFWLSQWEYYVIQKESNLCWVFTMGNANNPNWLMLWWEAVYLSDDLWTPFLENINCESWYASNCCKDLWYKYAGVPIGQSFVSFERAGAEYLASKKPVLVADIPALRDWLDNTSVFFYEPDNSNSLSQEINRVLAMEESEIQTKTTKAFQIAANWSYLNRCSQILEGL